MMKTRLATPAKLVDINGIAGLDTLERANGHLRVGALVRHADVAASDLTFGAVASAAPWISDPLVRNRGTLCGSVAHCDPEGDWNSVLLATGAEVIARGSNGERAIPITEFIVDFFGNALGRRRDGHRGAHPGARRAAPVARTRSSNARSATTPPPRSPPTSSWRPTAPSPGPASRSPRSNPVNTKVTAAEADARRPAADRRARSPTPASWPRRPPSRATTSAARPTGSATSSGCSPAGRSPRRRRSAGRHGLNREATGGGSWRSPSR